MISCLDFAWITAPCQEFVVFITLFSDLFFCSLYFNLCNCLLSTNKLSIIIEFLCINPLKHNLTSIPSTSVNLLAIKRTNLYTGLNISTLDQLLPICVQCLCSQSYF